MIQINTTLNTKDGLFVPSGSVINVDLSFTDEVVDEIVDGLPTGSKILNRYVNYGMRLYKSMGDYEAGKADIKTELVEFPFAYSEKKTLAELQTIDSINVPQQWLQAWIEGIIGAATTAIVYPTLG